MIANMCALAMTVVAVAGEGRWISKIVCLYGIVMVDWFVAIEVVAAAALNNHD